MRRADRALTDREEITSILDEALVCRIALQTDGAPYIVPLNFGYSWDASLVLYFHGAAEGRKHDLIRRRNVVGFELDVSHELVIGGEPCNWGMKYRSVIGAGRIEPVLDAEEKTVALDAIMRHYGYAGNQSYRDAVFAATTTYKLIVTELSAKKRD